MRANLKIAILAMAVAVGDRPSPRVTKLPSMAHGR